MDVLDAHTHFFSRVFFSTLARGAPGGPIDDDEDLDEAVWAGVLPLSLTPGPPIPAADLRSTPVPPDHVESWTVHRNVSTI